MLQSFARLDPNSILSLGSLLLACGAGGLLVVRLSNPRLKGIEWLGAAFASGGIGALLLSLSGPRSLLVGVVLADLLVTLAYILFYVAFLALRGGRSRWPKLGSLLLLVQLAGSLWMTYLHPVTRQRIVFLSIIISILLGQAGILLIRTARRGSRLASWFTAMVLLSLLLTNCYRCVVMLFLDRYRASGNAVVLQNFVFMAYIATALGIAFGFFWMTTAELSTELERMASIDPLTRIYNRRVFREWCEREFARSGRKGHTFSLLMMDLDHFKQINDRHGHKGGDDLLVAVVDAMQDSVRGINVLGRWGGEEFAALLPGAGHEAALIVAGRICSNIEKLALDSDAGPMRMTISLGATTLRANGDDLDKMLQRADQALYLAKQGGRNQVIALP